MLFKIVDIGVGAWHSGAVSAFGDLYVWGWNVNGQLGRPVQREILVNFDSGRVDTVVHKLPSVFPTPEVVNFPNSSDDLDDIENQYQIKQIFCGLRHTFVYTECGKLLGSGWNKYGQLGDLKSINDNVIGYDELKVNLNTKFNVKCGSWCTIFISS